jgi:hypothetical protein
MAAAPPWNFDALAAEIAARFVNPVRGGNVAFTTPTLEMPPVFLADVRVETEALRQQCEILTDHQFEFPCIEPAGGENRLPVPLSLAFELAKGLVDGQDLRREAYLQSQIWKESGRLVWVKVDDALDFYQGRLTGFLSARLAATPPAAQTQTGVPFQVDTQSHGLRVYYAPIYWHSNQRVLNKLSSPVTGNIQAGRYHFGAAQPGVTPQFDFSASYQLPPDSNAYLAM